MTQATFQQSLQAQEIKNKKAAHRRMHYRPQSANKAAQIALQVKLLEPKPLTDRIVSCTKHGRVFHHRSQPMPIDYSTQKYFYADKACLSVIQEAFVRSLT